jgi:hypothetical protein
MTKNQQARSLSVWSVSYGPRMIEVAAGTLNEARRIALGYLELRIEAAPTRLQVSPVDRTIIVEVQ